MRILLVDDELYLIAAIAVCLRVERPDWEVQVAGDGAEALELLRRGPVDLLVTDIQMPGMDGLSLLREVRQDARMAKLPVIFITARDDRASMREGMTAGADDYVTKPLSAEDLIHAIEGRMRRLEPGAEDRERAELLESLRRTLTDREMEVLALIGRGFVTKDIAERMDLSPSTVSVHRANIMRKLDVHNAAALAALAVRASMT